MDLQPSATASPAKGNHSRHKWSKAQVCQSVCDDLVALVRWVSVRFAGGQDTCYWLQTVRAVERMVGVRTGKAVRRRRFANHCAPGVKDESCWVRGFRRGNGATVSVDSPEPIVVWGDRPEDGWLSVPQGDDLGEDALEFRAENLRRSSRAG